MRDSRAIDEDVLDEVAAAFAFGAVRGPAEYVAGIVGRLLEKPVTLESLQALADLAAAADGGRGRSLGAEGSSSP